MGHAPPVPLDGGKDAVSHPRPATRASSWYTGAHTNDARTEEPGPPDGTRNRSARFGLPVGIGRRICARQSSSGTRGATGKPGQHGVVSRSSIIPAPPNGSVRGAVTVPPESHFLRVSHSPTEPRPVLSVLAVGACLLFIVMVVTIVIVVLLPARPGMAPNVCSTIECLVYGEQLASSIDSSMPPCHNFTHFVCGGWRREHRLSVREELSERVMERMTRLVRAIAGAGHVPEQRATGGGRLPQDAVHVLLYCSLKLGWNVILRVVPRWSDQEVTSFLVDPGEAYHFVIRRPRTPNADFQHYFENLRNIFLVPSNDVTTFEDVVHLEGFFRDELTAAYYERNEYEVYTSGHHFVYTFFDLWDNHGETGTYGYTSWCTVQVAALYANRDLILNYYGGSARRAQAYHGAFCVTAAYVFSRYALFGSYSAEIIRGNMLKMAENLTRAVGDSFLRRLTRWRHFKRHIQVVSNWSSLSKALRSFETVQDTEFAPTGLDMTDSFVQNWRKSTLVSRSTDDSVLLAATNSLELFAVYALGPQKNFQLLPAALSFPLFDTALTTPVVYAGFGVSVAWALGLLFLAAYSSDPMANATVAQLMNCVAGKPGGTALDVDAVTAVALAADAVLDALEQDAQVATELPIPRLEGFTPMQLFFIAMCFVHCEGGVSSGSRDDICDLSLRHVRRFALAFDCAAESPMNPAQRCEVP
ncbi:hypothetical protein HPB51_022849 [Rhipicephalus microplus]|uniref:M13 family peptidase n=1 Tax=Rhipicephalus microplus TaxID=6941 RepID=A0A9J6DQ42_RHIMP|nr:hypothetical protein HPB51_022849 [Rhipicephalus microplus]